jgi:hypothetical protein
MQLAVQRVTLKGGTAGCSTSSLTIGSHQHRPPPIVEIPAMPPRPGAPLTQVITDPSGSSNVRWRVRGR